MKRENLWDLWLSEDSLDKTQKYNSLKKNIW